MRTAFRVFVEQAEDTNPGRLRQIYQTIQRRIRKEFPHESTWNVRVEEADRVCTDDLLLPIIARKVVARALERISQYPPSDTFMCIYIARVPRCVLSETFRVEVPALLMSIVMSQGPVVFAFCDNGIGSSENKAKEFYDTMCSLSDLVPDVFTQKAPVHFRDIAQNVGVIVYDAIVGGNGKSRGFTGKPEKNILNG